MKRSSLALAVRLGELLSQSSATITTAESCTGGGIAAAITDVEGSSSWFERGFVTYSNQAKSDMLGVPTALLSAHGAVSEQVAEAMLVGALHASQATLGVAVSGIAGPGGGSLEKPVGTVYIAWGSLNRHSAKRFQFVGERADVRAEALCTALDLCVRWREAE